MTALPKFSCRADDDGFIVYMPESGRYLHANEAAQQGLVELQNADWTPDEADRSGLAALAAVLCGERERVVDPDDSGLRLVPLSDVLGASADRCETFGMPL